jgi:HSP90 family molecular chaperone
MTDQIDEYLTQDKVKAYKSFPLQNVGKSGLMFGDEEDSVAVGVELKKKFEPLTDWLKDILSSEVEEVEVSTVFYNLNNFSCLPQLPRLFFLQRWDFRQQLKE